MVDQSLNSLCIRVIARPEQDVVLIYADPVLEDLRQLLASKDDDYLFKGDNSISRLLAVISKTPF